MALKMEMEILRHRKLLWLFVKRDLRARYTGSVLGVLWSVVHPLLMLAIYVTVIGFILGGGRFENGKMRSEWFAIFLCCGLFPWNWAAESFNGAAASISGNGALIKRAVFPISILPIQAIAGAFINFAITFGLFLLTLAAFQLAGSWDYLQRLIVLLPLIALLQFCFLLGPCFLLATLNAFFRDTAQIINALLLIGFWITPIIYDPAALVGSERLPAGLRQAFIVFCQINPFAHLVGLYQSLISKTELPPLGSVIYLMALSILAYVAGKYLFTRCQRHFADVI